jgi:hypothetical protein
VIGRDDSILGSPMIVELCTRKREIRDDDEIEVITSGYDKSCVRLAILGWEDVVSV